MAKFRFLHHSYSIILLSIFSILNLSTFISGCSTSQKKPLKRLYRIKTRKNEAAYRQIQHYKKIEFFYLKNSFDDALSEIDIFKNQFPNSKWEPAIENFYGMILLKKGNPTLAIPHFENSISHYSNYSLQNKNDKELNASVFYNLACAHLSLKEYDSAEKATQKIDIESLEGISKVKAYLLKVTILQEQGLFLLAIREILNSAEPAEKINTPEAGPLIYEKLDENLTLFLKDLKDPKELAPLESLLTEFDTSSKKDALLFHISQKHYDFKLIEQVKFQLQALIDHFPKSPYFTKAVEILKKINQSADTTPVDTSAIGILLPTQGKFGKYGSQCLQAIQLALGSSVRLILEDSGDTPEQGLSALDRLVKQHHVAAIIGPLLTKGVDLITTQAQMLRVPLISLTRRAGIEQDFVFHAGLTQQMQASEIARFAINHLKLKNFAILYPKEKLGIEAGFSFWDAIESMGGKIVGIESYSPGETDFRKIIDKISGLYYADARQKELDILAREREANQIKKRTRKTETFFNLRPIVDYDAIFISDEPASSGQIIPTFAYRDINEIQFLGTSSWNSPDFIYRIQPYESQISFVDAFLQAPSSFGQLFMDQFKTNFHNEPSLFEALAYDAGLILKEALRMCKNSFTRGELKETLKKIQNLEGATGTLSFKKGHFYRNLNLIQIKRGVFVKIL